MTTYYDVEDYRAAVRTVGCTFCGAVPDESCRFVTSHRGETHVTDTLVAYTHDDRNFAFTHLVPHLAGARCPSCGHHSLTTDASQQLVCEHADCPRPSAAQELLSEPMSTRHVVVLTDVGCSVRHPLVERLDDALLDCWPGDHLIKYGSHYLANGRVKAGERYYVTVERDESTLAERVQAIADDDDGRARLRFELVTDDD